MGKRTAAQPGLRWAQRYRELGTGSIPSTPYTSDAYLDRELDLVFRKSWLNVARAEDLPEPGSYLVLDLEAVHASVLVTRGRDGGIHAFHNVCTHRGSRLVQQPHGHASLLTCRYHGWSFNLDGRLVAVPDEHKFDGLDKSDCGLMPIRCGLWNGYVFIRLDGSAEESLESSLAQIAPSFDGYPFGELRKQVSYEAEVEANWKVALDIGEEPYHFLFVHRKSIPDSHTGVGQELAYFPSVKLHSRHRSASVVANSLRSMRPSERVAYQQGSTVIQGGDPSGWAPGLNPDKVENWAFDVHVLFPNCEILLGVGWSIVHRFWPIAVNRTRWKTTVYMTPARNAGERLSQEFSKVLTRDLLREDLAMVEINQAGLQICALPRLQLSDEEILLRHNYHAVEAALAGGPATRAQTSGDLPIASSDDVHVRAGSGQRTAICHARIIDGTGRAPLEDRTILIEGARIKAVMPTREDQIADVRRIDASGRTVIPGLIDMHAHLISGGFDTVVDNGASYDPQMQARVLNQMLYWGVVGCHFSVQPVDNALWLKSALARGEIQGPRLFCSGPGVTAPAGWAGTNMREARLELDDPQQAAAAIAKLAESGLDFVKIFYDDMCCAFHQALPKLRKDVMQAVVREAHRHGLPVAAHVYDLPGHREALEAGADLLYHSAVTGPIDQSYIDLALAQGSAYIATLSIYNDTYNPDAVRAWAATAEVRESVPEHTLRTLGAGGPLDLFETFTKRKEMARRLPTIMANLRKVHEAGIPFAAGPDTGVPGVFPGISVHREMELMAQAGVPPMAVLQAATHQAAALAGEPLLGTIERGQHADLLILADDPLRDIRATRSIISVIKDGKVVDRARLLGRGQAAAAA